MFVGLLFGIILAKYTKDEFKSGKKYFVLFSKVMLFLIILYLLYFVNLSFLSVVLFIFGFIIYYFFRNIYFYFGLAYFGSLNIYLAVFGFLFGLPYGTLVYYWENKKEYVLGSFVLFFVSSLILFLNIDFSYIFSFVAGSLFNLFLRKVL